MFVSQTLGWVRAALFGPRTPGRRSSAAAPQETPPASRRRPTADVWGARLVIARLRRADRYTGTPYPPQPQARAEWFPPRDWEAEHTGPLVRPYIDAQGDSFRGARTGAQVDSRGRVQ